jgi:hypothetical protein
MRGVSVAVKTMKKGEKVDLVLRPDCEYLLYCTIDY